MVFSQQNIEATSKDSDQTVRMRRLIWGFAGRTYHIVGNLMSRLSHKFQLSPTGTSLQWSLQVLNN